MLISQRHIYAPTHDSFEIAHALNLTTTIRNQFGTHIDHAHDQICGIIDRRRGDIHEISEPKMLFRSAKIELNLKVLVVSSYASDCINAS